MGALCHCATEACPTHTPPHAHPRPRTHTRTHFQAPISRGPVAPVKPVDCLWKRTPSLSLSFSQDTHMHIQTPGNSQLCTSWESWSPAAAKSHSHHKKPTLIQVLLAHIPASLCGTVSVFQTVHSLKVSLKSYYHSSMGLLLAWSNTLGHWCHLCLVLWKITMLRFLNKRWIKKVSYFYVSRFPTSQAAEAADLWKNVLWSGETWNETFWPSCRTLGVLKTDTTCNHEPFTSTWRWKLVGVDVKKDGAQFTAVLEGNISQS